MQGISDSGSKTEEVSSGMEMDEVKDEIQLKVNGLSASYGETRVLYDVSLEVKKGELVALVGPNGAGKTTTLRCISGVLRQLHGDILFEGKAISKLPANEIASLGISLVPEGRGLFTTMSVKENLELGAFTARARAELHETLQEVYSLFPVLKDRANQQAGSLSGGEQQMLAIGRALMSRPKLLLLDEPSLGLAPIVTQKVFDTLRSLKDGRMSILLVEQNLHAALEISDRAYLLENGRIVLHGSSKEFRDNPQIRESYLGL
ncbi:MAG: ABC transporter ATP-binding protein [Conexivisphaerales archaeon]